MSVVTLSTGGNRYVEGEIILFDKPYGWTSFDLVKKVRNTITRTYRIKKLKVGHAGTLDPLATGLMVVCTGKATKMADQFQAEEKEYLATLKLGATTPSFDLETEEDMSYPTEHITEDFLLEILKQFKGNLLQVPPVFSAVKIDGKRAYEHARKGNQPELKPKNIVIHGIEIISFQRHELILSIICSKGTYIRALARDLGEALRSGAYLTGLKRIRSGNFYVKDAVTIEAFTERLHNEREEII